MLTLKTMLVIAAGAASLLVPQMAYAIEGKAASGVNVRSGPGKDFSVVDQLVADEAVEITECAPSGWCYVKHDGPDGWVSAKFLLPVDEDSEEESAGAGSNPDCGFGFSIGSGGPSLVVNCGDGAVTPPPAPAPAADDEGDDEGADGPQACFYKKAGFSGDSFCMTEGSTSNLPAKFDDTITSVEVSAGLKAKLCVDKNLGGYCKTVTVDTDDLPSQIDDEASSITVVSADEADEPAPANPPVIILKPKLDPSVLKNIGKLLVPDTYSTNSIDWKLSYTIDLDEGTQGEVDGNDLWYEVGDGENFITPTNGGLIASTNGFAQHGYQGCKTAEFSDAKISTQDAGVGSYICVKTNDGRISEFRINGYKPDFTMKIGYTTWAN